MQAEKKKKSHFAVLLEGRNRSAIFLCFLLFCFICGKFLKSYVCEICFSPLNRYGKELVR